MFYENYLSCLLQLAALVSNFQQLVSLEPYLKLFGRGTQFGILCHKNFLRPGLIPWCSKLVCLLKSLKSDEHNKDASLLRYVIYFDHEFFMIQAPEPSFQLYKCDCGRIVL